MKSDLTTEIDDAEKEVKNAVEVATSAIDSHMDGTVGDSKTEILNRIEEAKLYIKDHFFNGEASSQKTCENSPQACSDGVCMEGQCFRLYTDPKLSWDNAKKSCAEKGAYLAVPNTSQEQDAVHQLTKDVHGYPWIGIYGMGDKKYYDITTEQPVIFDGQADVEKYPWVTRLYSDYPLYEDFPSVLYVATDMQAGWTDDDRKENEDIYICENSLN